MNKKLIVFGILLLVVIYLFSSQKTLKTPQVSNGAGGGTAVSILTGLDKPVKIPFSKLAGLFEAVPGGEGPSPLFYSATDASVRAVDIGATISGIDEASLIDVKTAGTIPPEFKKFVINGVLFGIARFDALYHEKDFSLRSALAAKHLRLLISSDRQLFALKNVSTFRHGYVEPCAEGNVASGNCVPEIRIFFEASKWNGSEYDVMNQLRIAHELFHVAHIYLLSSVGKLALFSVPGYYWQTESFATVSQRNIPDREAYLSFGNSMMSESYFKWPKLSNKDYEKSYEISPFIDELAYRSGEGLPLLTHWIKESRAGENASISLMRVLGTETKEDLDISKFQDLYVRSILNLYFPAILYPSIDVDTRTIGAYSYPENLQNIGSKLPASFDMVVPALGSKFTSVKLAGNADFEKAKKLTLTIEIADKKVAQNLRGVVVGLRNGVEELELCYGRIGDVSESEAKNAARDCFNKNAVLLGIWGADAKEPIKLNTSVIKELGSGATIGVLLLNTIGDASQSIDQLTKSITATIKLDTDTVASASKGARFFPTIEGDSYGYTGGFGAGPICYMQQYSDDKPLPAGASRQTFINVDPDTGDVTGEGHLKLAAYSCNLIFKGKMDPKTKLISGTISGNSLWRTYSSDWEIKNFGTLDISTSFEGTVDLGKYRESHYVDQSKGLDRTSWVWDGTYNITFKTSKTDSSTKLDPKDDKNGPAVGTTEKGTFHMDMVVKE